MKRAALLILFILPAMIAGAQTVENIRVTQDGDNLKINYRIGASTDDQLYNVYMTCSMDGGARFEPKAVIGDVGGNIIGGKSFYTIIWDVFEDVDEVVNPEFFVRVELVSDMSPDVPPATRNQPTTQPTTQPQTTPQQQSSQYEPDFEIDDQSSGPDFSRNAFFSYNGIYGFGLPLGISFGTLNAWGYYVTPIRLGIVTYDYLDPFEGLVTELDIHYMLSAGVTRHIVSGGSVYRLHGYAGLGAHVYGQYLLWSEDPINGNHAMIETGLIHVLGGFNLTVGLSFHPGYTYVTNFVFGAGFVF
jgi:hypothetical protein